MAFVTVVYQVSKFTSFDKTLASFETLYNFNIMWLLLIIAHFMLWYTVARCPKSSPTVFTRCRRRNNVCTYRNHCYCRGAFRFKTKYLCGREKRWRVHKKNRLRKCPPCPRHCGCASMKTKTVCGVNGRTYRNMCVMRCNKEKMACQGSCPCKHRCLAGCKKHRTMLLCATNRKTYRNGCSMKCGNAKFRCRGKCPCRKK